MALIAHHLQSVSPSGIHLISIFILVTFKSKSALCPWVCLFVLFCFTVQKETIIKLIKWHCWIGTWMSIYLSALWLYCGNRKRKSTVKWFGGCSAQWLCVADGTWRRACSWNGIKPVGCMLCCSYKKKDAIGTVWKKNSTHEVSR